MAQPTLADLQGMYGAGHPQAYLQAQDNAALERQYREAEYAKQLAENQKQSLDNMFQEQDDPQRLRERVLTNQNKQITNENLGYTTTSNRLKSEREVAQHINNLNADQRKALASVTEDHLKEADQQVELLRRSLDPRKQAEGEKLYQLTGVARALKEQRESAMGLESYKQGQETGRKVEEIASRERISANELAAGKFANKGRGKDDVSVAQSLAKVSPDKRIGYVEGILSSGVDPDTKEPLSPAARAYYEAMYTKDIEVLNAKPNPVPPSVGLQVPGPGQAPVLAPTPGRVPIVPTAPKGGASAPVTSGTTKSGAKWRVVP